MEEEELRCLKLSTSEICPAHKSEGDIRFVSHMCPLIATPNHCINPQHSNMDHEPKHCEDPEHIHEREGKMINFLTRLRQVGSDEMDTEESEDEGFSEEVKVGWSYDASKNVMRLTQRTAQQMATLTPTMQIQAKRDLADRDILEILLYCDSGSCLNLVSQKKARKDGVKIKQSPHPYTARDVQGKPLNIIRYAEYYLLNKNNYVRRVECAVSRQGSAADVIINLETLKKMGVVDEDFPKIKNDKFEESAEKLSDVSVTDKTDEYEFSNRYVHKV